MAESIKMSIISDHTTKQIHLSFNQMTDHVSIDVEGALKMARIIEEKAKDMIGKIIVFPALKVVPK